MPLLLMLVFILLAVGFIGIYQANVYMPEKSPWTVYVPQEILPATVNSFTNYDLVSISPDRYGYLITYKNRSKLIDMWQ